MKSSALLKRPTGVFIIAVLFLLAPFGNILISFAGSGVQNWYDLSVLMPFLNTIPAWDWLWLGLLFVTGLLLFFPHKLSWTIAIFTLLLVLFVNAYRLYSINMNSIDPSFLKVFSVLAIVCTISILVISLYFRFPYLDRRANWFLNEDRFSIRTDVMVNDIKGTTESISYTGCRLNYNEDLSYDKGTSVKLKFIEISKIEVEAQVVDKNAAGLRLAFVDISNDFRQDLGRWLKSRSS